MLVSAFQLPEPPLMMGKLVQATRYAVDCIPNTDGHVNVCSTGDVRDNS